VTIPKKLRDALGLSAGDRLEFALDGPGELRARKAAPAHPRVDDAQRHAAELVAVLRALD
jgi:AbrB family looped-hinge helix DNA binding protein